MSEAHQPAAPARDRRDGAQPSRRRAMTMSTRQDFHSRCRPRAECGHAWESSAFPATPVTQIRRIPGTEHQWLGWRCVSSSP